MWSQHRLWQAFPAIAVAIIIAATPILAMWNAAVGFSFPAFHVTFGKPLKGEELPNVEPSLSSFFNGNFQKFIATAAIRALPARALLTRTFNQINYSVFRHRDFGQVEVGANGVLYEAIYRGEYCTRNLAEFEPRGRHWASLIAEIQNSLARAGKKFIYVITPSKIAAYPEYLGDHPCPAPEKDRLGLLPLYHRLLDEAGVHYVDAASIVAEKRHDYEIDLFPPSGGHWMTFSAFLAMNRFIDELNGQAGHRLLPNLKASYMIGADPDTFNTDIFEILNLLVPPPVEPAFLATIEPTDPKFPQTCKEVKIGEVGGSYLSHINRVLMETHCASIYYYFYWNLSLFKYSNGRPLQILSKDEIGPAEQRQLLDCDVVVLEENEQMLTRANHTQALHDFLMASYPSAHNDGAGSEPSK